MAALTHPNVVNVYDYGHAPPTSGGAPYLVMSYVPGVPLSQRIAQAGRLSVAETGSVLIQAAAALHAVHRAGIVHCDVKPANLLIAPDGGVTLVDFGVAHSATVTAGRTGRTVIGTALYMAPEQVTGRRVSSATDIYALDAVAYHCLSGQGPFTGDTSLEIALRHLSDEPAPLSLDLPAAVRMLVARALSKDPAQRYPPRPPSPARYARPWCTRTRPGPRWRTSPGCATRRGSPGGPQGASPPSPPCWSAVR
jgi:serine/threonine protein kinase